TTLFRSTTVRDLGAPRRTVLELRNKIDSGKLVGPTVVCSGPPIVMTGGHVSILGYESDGKDEVRKNTRKVFKEGADLIKVMATGGIYTDGEEPGSVQLNLVELRAVKEEALIIKNTRKGFNEGADLIRIMVASGIYSKGEEPEYVQLNLDELIAVK